MKNEKKVLLIAGGGTLGRYTAEELLRLGCRVDTICLENYVSDDERLNYFKADANLAFLQDFLKDKHYDGIVNFIHYPEVEDYKPVHKLLCGKTDHLIFLSSYRVYADLEHPVKETSPQLCDTLTDESFFKNERYALSKSLAEKFIRNESESKNWTIVRPVISFSDRRLDIFTMNGRIVVDTVAEGSKILLPSIAKDIVAGLDWSGNSGKLIANLLFKKEAVGEAFTVSSAQNLTWGKIAEYYTELAGTQFEWVGLDEFKTAYPKTDKFILYYDRLFNRVIDNSKILKVTGLNDSDFLPIKSGIKIELDKLMK